MYKICAACLHWGNSKFKQRPREEQAEVADPKGTASLSRFVLSECTHNSKPCIILVYIYVHVTVWQLTGRMFFRSHFNFLTFSVLFCRVGQGVILVGYFTNRLWKVYCQTKDQSWSWVCEPGSKSSTGTHQIKINSTSYSCSSANCPLNPLEA